MTIQPAVFSLFYWHPFLFPPSPLPRPVKNSGRQTGRCFIHPGATSGMFPPGASSRPCWKNCVRHANFPRIWLRRISPPGGKSPESHATTDEIPPPGGYPRPRSGKNRAKRTLPGGKMGSLSLPGSRRTVPGAPAEQRFRQNPVPVLFCIPGSDQTKEELAGETSPDLDQPSVQQPGNNAMAFHYVRQGWAAIVVDNAGTGEEGDAERAAGRSSHDYETWPASCWKWTGAGWATPPTRTNVFWIG